MPRVLEDVQLAVRARQALDDRAREGDRDELVLGAVDVEQRQIPNPGPSAIARSAATKASSVGRFQPPCQTSGSAA